MNIAKIKLEALELINRHSHAIDGADAKAYANLFTEDGLLVFRKTGNDGVQYRGRKALADYASRLFRERGDDQPRHHVRNTIFKEVSESKAATATYFLATNVSAKGGMAVVTDTGVYHDILVETGNGWRFEERIVIYD